MKKRFLLLLIICLTFSFSLINLKLSLSQEKNQFLNFYDVTIEVRDENGNFIENPEIYVYSLDYGVMYPNIHQDIKPTNQGNLKLCEGKWEFIAGKNISETSSAKGYFLVKRLYIKNSQTVILKPDSEIGFVLPKETPDFSRMEIRMVEKEIVPLGVPINVLNLNQSNFLNSKILTNNEFKYKLTITIDFKSINEYFLIYKDNIIPNRLIEISLNKGDYGVIDFEAYDKNFSKTKTMLYLNFYNSDFYIRGNTAYFIFYGYGKVYISPGKWFLEPIVSIDFDSYSFSYETLIIDKNSNLKFSYGGELKPKLKIVYTNDVLCPRLKNRAQIFIETKDSFGNLLTHCNQFRNKKVPLKLFQNNKLIYEMDLTEYDPFITLYGNIIDMDLNINNPPDYLIELDLGHFGYFELKGKLFSQDTKLEYESLSTEHFILNYPKGYKEKFEIYGKFIEDVSKSLSQYTGIEIKGKTTINFFFGNITGVSTKGRFDCGAAEVLYDSIYRITGGLVLIAFHEHSHSFQFELDEPYFTDNEFFGESICDEIASFGYEYFWGYPVKLIKLGDIQTFLYKAFEYILDPINHPINLSEQYNLQAAGNMRFILRYLEIKYGEDIHKKFIESWSKKGSPNYVPKTVFDGLNLNDYEKITSIYSYIVGENVSNLFNFMGYKVDSSKIDKVMNRIRSIIIDAFTPVLVINEPDIKISKEIYTNSNSIKISGRTEKDAILFIGGKNIPLHDDGDFEVDFSPLYPGTNSILIVAKDKVGNSSSTILSIIYDNQPPEIKIDYPSQNIFINSKEIEIKGSVKDSLSGVRELKINNENVLIFENGSFSKTITLSEGENNIKLISTDKVGNQKEEVLTIYVDTSPPEIFISIPKEVYDELLNINGYVKDEGLSGIKDFSILINGEKIELTRSLSFTHILKLNLGDNEIKFEIEDNAGNKSSKTFIVKYFQKTIMKLQIGNKTMYINDSTKEIDVPPQIIEGRTYLPIRWIAEPLGATVLWDGNEKKVTIILKEIKIELLIGKSVAKVNGVDTPIDPNNPKVVPLIIQGRTMLPIRFVAENLGCQVEWDAKTQTVTIIYPKD